MATIAISLPAHLKSFVDSQVTAKGHVSRSEYIGLLVQKAYLEQHHEQIEKLLLEGLDSGPATPLTADDWKDIEREGLARLTNG